MSTKVDAILDAYYNLPAALSPTCFFQPTNTTQVSQIIAFFSQAQCKFAVKAGGQMLFVGSNAIQDGTQTASVEAGAKWREVYTTWEAQVYFVPGAEVSDVGVAGLRLGGGISFFAARYGFVCDNIKSFEIVLGNDTVISANATHNPDLFKALKGGSGNLGLVTGFDFAAFTGDDLWGARVTYNHADVQKSFQPMVDWADQAAFDLYESVIRFWGRASLGVAYIYNLTSRLNLPSGLRNIYAGVVFEATTPVLTYVNEVIRDVYEPIYKDPPYTFLLAEYQPIPYIATQHSINNGGNVLGLDRVKGNVIVLMLVALGNDPIQDTRVRELMDATMGNVTNYTQSVGAYRPWQYVSYAYEDEDSIGSYGDDNVKSLKIISLKLSTMAGASDQNDMPPQTQSRNSPSEDSTTDIDKETPAKKPSLIKRTWDGSGLNPGMLMMMIKGALPPTISLAVYQSTDFAQVYSTLGYLVAIMSVLSFAILPRSKYIQTMLFNIIGLCIGAAVALLEIYCSVQARAHTTPSVKATGNGPSPGTAVSNYNSSASAVSAIWLFFNIYLVNTLRASRPQLQFPVIIYSIFANVASVYAPTFPTMVAGIAFAKRLLEAFLTGFAIATGVSLFIFPVSVRMTFFKQSAGFIAAVQSTLKAQISYLQTLEKKDMFRNPTASDEDEKYKKSNSHKKGDTAKPNGSAEAQRLKAMNEALVRISGMIE
ncbi:hypothetical protein HO133_001496 [Letharia lupina]|uniref:FAD-binding PCMH-type domain-containing protein n=1 Tax=Letharia lupina TaxID=560253 RepID=A0A8H6FBL9_9LECA|nr:uncharacterized protein HO133_001496 [Letharia lupina]KAF6222410.1 hypothetical protein HO133_001496 [Letharia lupina]